eukprot:TRINITY_DN21242_c0_g1_i2.p1 TRINITY_DN21242_c0_g1~~TRINITY_DN21242_c0_g1_i2.p1  ORF type:complete len:387 (+),score=23.99 TRINITY_DN21242_c0_g1_i2:54-1214(+)
MAAFSFCLLAALWNLCCPYARGLKARSFDSSASSLRCAGASCVAQASSASPVADCISSGRTKFSGTFDVVITWYTQSHQSDIHPGFVARSTNGSVTQKRIHNQSVFIDAGIENQNEISYLLRSIDQFGMLAYVGKLFIMLDREIVKRYGAPRNVNWNHPVIRPVYAQDLGVSIGSSPQGLSQESKLAAMHRIPGISEWFLYLNDDVFLTNTFSLDMLFDGEKPRYFTGVDLFQTQPHDCPTKGFPQIESAHMPWLVNKCYMEKVEEEFSTYFQAVKEQAYSRFNVMCTYDSWVNGNGLTSQAGDFEHRYGICCHLGQKFAQCPVGTNAEGAAAVGAFETVLKNPPVFLNLQGNGVSDEYDSHSSVRARVLHWLHGFFKPSDLVANS